MATNHCKWCGRYQTAHTIDACSYYKAALAAGRIRALKVKAKMDSGGKRVCGYCADINHASTKCPTKFNKRKAKLSAEIEAFDKAFEWLHEIGFGPGAMLNGMANEYRWNARTKEEKMVVIEDFRAYTFQRFINELVAGKQRNWYFVDAVDTSNEKVKRIYLPYHSFYAPKPTSKNVSVISKADPAEIDKMKNKMACYSSPVMKFNSAEEFFKAGYKFKAGSDEVISPA
jgi:hypothetical protein